MMEFAEQFDHEADDVMDDIMADTSMSPTLTPFVGLGSSDSAVMDGPTTARQADANDLFQSFDDGAPSIDRMKRIGLHHDEAFEL